MSFWEEHITPPQERGFRTLREQVEQLRKDSANPIQRTPTGLRQLDQAIVGVGRGELLMFAARAGNGKSAFATQMMVNNPNAPIIFFSLEMPAPRVMQRMWAQLAGVPADDLEIAAMNNQLPLDMDSMEDKLPRQIVVDSAGLRYQDMAAYIESFEQAYEVRPVAVIIDYLELVGGMKSKGEISAETVAAVANQAKEFAVEQDLGVVLLHQLNQSVKEWEPPHKGSLRYGGLAESDFVVGLWRPGLDPDLKGNDQILREREVGINVIKNRIFGREPRFLRYALQESLRLVDLDGLQRKR